jgi:cytochrome c2
VGQCGPACTTTRCTSCHTDCSGGGNLRLGPSLPGRLTRPAAPAFPGRRP